MLRKSKINTGIATIIISILAAGIMTADESFAFRRENRGVVSARVTHEGKAVVRKHERHNRGRYFREGKRIIVSPHAARHGTVVKKLPHRHNRVWFKNTDYYFNKGAFYRRGPSGFIVISAPVGAVIATLPIGYKTVWVNGSNYYYYGDVVYRRVPAGYVVVEEPDRIIATEEPGSLIQPSENASGSVSVTVSTLNVRSGPDLEYPLIHQVNEDSILRIHGRADGWLYVQLPEGQYGWVKAVFTNQLEPGSG